MRTFWGCASAILASGLFCVPAVAQDDAKPDLTGTWQLDATKSEMPVNRLAGLTMLISEKNGKININEIEKLADGKERKMTYTCTTDGKECEVPGTKAKASFWYNGPMLVSMETERNGANVTRQRLKLSPDSKSLNVEISNLVPGSDKTDKLVLLSSSRATALEAMRRPLHLQAPLSHLRESALGLRFEQPELRGSKIHLLTNLFFGLLEDIEAFEHVAIAFRHRIEYVADNQHLLFSVDTVLQVHPAVRDVSVFERDDVLPPNNPPVNLPICIKSG